MPSFSFASSFFEATKKQALSGKAQAQYNLAVMYRNGEGVAKNNKEAFKWINKAAIQGDAKAQYMVGLMYYYGHGVAKNN